MELPLKDLSEREQQRLAIAVLSHSDTECRQIAQFLDIHEDTVERWQAKNEGDFRIWDLPRAGRERTYGVDIEDRFIAFFCQTKPFGDAGNWSLRWAENYLKTNKTALNELMGLSSPESEEDKQAVRCPSTATMHRMLNRHDLKPHKNRYFLQITDPDFFEKMERLIELYKNPPEYLFCFDECPGIQILKRLVPDMYPGDEGGQLRWINEFEYIRNGTTDLFAFLNVNSGTVKASFQADHKKETFIEEFKKHAGEYPPNATLNYIMDNLSSHVSYAFCQLVAELSNKECPPQEELKSKDQRRQWLQQKDKRIIINFTPFHGSWLNMAEIVFRLVSEKVLKGSFSSPDELHQAVERYFEQWNENWAHPFSWKYDGRDLHEKVVQRFTSILSHSAEKMTLQYLTKSSKLMLNMIDNYWDEVPLGTWQKLLTVIREKELVLKGVISESEQPIVQKNAQEALERFMVKANALSLELTAA